MPMPKRTGRIRIKRKGQGLPAEGQVLYLGPDRRIAKTGRRSGFGRRRNATDFTQSVILGRREAGMTPTEIRAAQVSWSGRRNTSLGSRAASVQSHDAAIPFEQTTRRWSTTRRTGLDRRNGSLQAGQIKEMAVEWKEGTGAIFVPRKRHRVVTVPVKKRKGHIPSVEPSEDIM
ncbi:MAG: hypothetical protein Q7R47_02965 [Candidatus Diapherotrites archaeon]|nr:hypothetical protein [Candidatus Diapherotrites archaeon]